MHHIWIFIVAIGLLNMPFGFWRKGVKKFSLAWFLAVHIPVPLAIGIRYLAGVGWNPSTLPFFIIAFLAGQFLGGRCIIFFQKRCRRQH
jgi:hypothetical protein